MVEQNEPGSTHGDVACGVVRFACGKESSAARRVFQSELAARADLS
jgi:hypothetical protein